ncbi:anaphase-promoting complex subunit 15-like [Rhynchophorus ferrugineus]|uniref:Anaphase-promoting complex subunit 15 n=1 Tax=Rhynchophorus ferrugineus TaxID=354439 RepID=A0A834HTN1_RHYFE|nr:hypothetical protein GWI33_020841 [Rhynchophorus ferrugineus]
MSLPLFPKCLPKLTDRAWFDVDHPCDHEDEISQLEREHQDWVENILRTNDQPPIGKTSSEAAGDDEDEEEEDNDDDDDDDSETHDDEEEDEIEMEGAN